MLCQIKIQHRFIIILLKNSIINNRNKKKIYFLIFKIENKYVKWFCKKQHFVERKSAFYFWKFKTLQKVNKSKEIVLNMG